MGTFAHQKWILNKAIILQLCFINEIGEEFCPQEIPRKH